jgi:hypothetical protein
MEAADDARLTSLLLDRINMAVVCRMWSVLAREPIQMAERSDFD